MMNKIEWVFDTIDRYNKKTGANPSPEIITAVFNISFNEAEMYLFTYNQLKGA